MHNCNKHGLPSSAKRWGVCRYGWWLFLLVFLLTNVPESLAGGGWVLKKRTFYGKLNVVSFRTNRYYNLDGQLNDQGAQFRQTSLNLYAEYGLTSRLTVILNTPLFRSNSFSNTTATTGFGDAMVELKYGILTGPVHIAVGVAPQFPTGKSRALVDNLNRPGDQINLPIGDGEFNVWGRGYVSIPVSSRGYVSFDGGYNLRTQGFSNQYSAGVELGYKIGTIWVNGTVRQLGTIGTPNTSKGSFVYGEGLEYTAFSLGASIPLNKKLSATLDYSNMIGSSKNTYAGPIYGAGLAIQLQ